LRPRKISSDAATRCTLKAKFDLKLRRNLTHCCVKTLITPGVENSVNYSRFEFSGSKRVVVNNSLLANLPEEGDWEKLSPVCFRKTAISHNIFRVIISDTRSFVVVAGYPNDRAGLISMVQGFITAR